MRRAALALLCLISASCSPAPQPAPLESPPLPEADSTEIPGEVGLLSWSDLLAQDRPEPSLTLKIADGPTDLVDLWLPETPGPHPVIIMVHGGCWQKAVADRKLMNYGAEDLRQRGFAVWNIEYRGVDEKGGGYPGTYLDVAAAADSLKAHADAHNLDLGRVAGTGHSAGGHLITWLSARSNLPETSPLYTPDPISLRGVVSTGGLADLELSTRVTQADCLASILDDLTGQSSESRPDVFADTSPARLLPLPYPHLSLSGDMDRISPPGLAEAFAAKDRNAGGRASALIISGTNHVDLIAPGTAAWEAQVKALEDMLTPRD